MKSSGLPVLGMHAALFSFNLNTTLPHYLVGLLYPKSRLGLTYAVNPDFPRTSMLMFLSSSAPAGLVIWKIH
jgi:hypothetical protein